MIKPHIGPAGSNVAVFASVAGGDVVAWLASGSAAVVASRTSSGDCGMVKAYVAPTGGDMAIVASVAGRDVIARFAGSGAAVVAGDTCAGD